MGITLTFAFVSFGLDEAKVLTKCPLGRLDGRSCSINEGLPIFSTYLLSISSMNGLGFAGVNLPFIVCCDAWVMMQFSFALVIATYINRLSSSIPANESLLLVDRKSVV